MLKNKYFLISAVVILKLFKEWCSFPEHNQQHIIHAITFNLLLKIRIQSIRSLSIDIFCEFSQKF